MRYQSEDQVMKSEIKFTETEEKIQKILAIEHNTVDIINENLKMKEALKFIRSAYAADLLAAQEKERLGAQSLEDLLNKVAALTKSNELKTAEIQELNLALQKKKKDYDEIYALLGEREREIEHANAYADQLLNDKKKLLAIVEQKDRRIEQLNVDLFQKEQKLQAALEELNRYKLDGNADKNKLGDMLARQAEKIAELTRVNAELLNEIAGLEDELKKLQARPADDANLKAELEAKSKELAALKSELGMTRDALAREKDTTANQRTALGDWQRKYNDLKAKYDELAALLAAKAQELDEERAKNDQLTKKVNNQGDRLEQLQEEYDDLDKRFKQYKADTEVALANKNDLANQIKNLKAANQALTDQLSSKDSEIAALRRQIEQLKADKDKQAKTIADLQAEIDKLRKQLDDKQRDYLKLLADLDLMRKELSGHIDGQSEHDAELQRLRNEGNSRLEELRSQIAALEKKLKESDEKNRALALKYNQLVDQHEKLRSEYNGIVQKLNELENEKGDLEHQLARLQEELAMLTKKFNDQSRDLDMKSRQLADALAELERLRQNAGSKSALEDYKKEVAAKMLELLYKLAATKNRLFDVRDELMDTTSSNYAADEAKIKSLSPDQYFGFAMTLVTEADATLPDISQELTHLMDTITNLKKEKTKLLLRVQEIESKLSDMTFRHDEKTKMVGKLVVKLAVLTTEIERLAGAK